MVTRECDLDGLIPAYLESLTEGEEPDATIEDLIDRWEKWKKRQLEVKDDILTYLPFSEDEIEYLNSRILDGLMYAFQTSNRSPRIEFGTHLPEIHYVSYSMGDTPAKGIHFNDMTRVVCESGYLETCRWLYTNLRVHPDWYYIYNIPFELACANGHLKIAQWMCRNLPNINVHADNEYAFRYACINGHLETAKWLLEHFPTINYRILDDWAFCVSSWNGHIEVVKWLFDLTQKPEVNSTSWQEAINLAILHDDTVMLEWLRSKQK